MAPRVLVGAGSEVIVMELFGTTALDSLEEWTRPRSRHVAGIARAGLTTVLRLGAGASVIARRGPRPLEQLVLYEREGCPHSRRAREALAMLDLDVLSKPVPFGSTRHAGELEVLTGASTVPVLVDRGAGVVVQESDAIVEHLFARYGATPVPLRLRIRATSELASKIAGDHGVVARPSMLPDRPLELEGYEGSPATRLARERLTELEIPYLSRQLAPHSPRRSAYFARAGTMELPHLFDPTHRVSRFGAEAILAWLDETYALPVGGTSARAPSERGVERAVPGPA